jgi:subtilase family serine protease
VPVLSLPARRSALAALVSVGLVAGSALVAAPADAAGHRVAVPAARPSWVAAAADQGAVDDATTVELQLALELPDEQGAKDFATAVSTPGTAQYRHYLTPSAWIDRFSPTQAAVDTVAQAVHAAGLEVSSAPKSRLFLVLRGSAARVDAFFATRLHAYDIDGETRLAPASTATLPQNVARHLAAVAFTHPLVTSGPAAKKAKQPKVSKCSAYWGQHTIAIHSAYGKKSAPTPICGYTPKQLRALYGLSRSPLDGAGQTIAIIDAFGSPTMRRDLATFSARNGIAPADYTQYLAPASSSADTFGCDPSGWQMEQTLDLEAAHAVAPKAKLVYVGAADCGYGFDTAMSRVLDDGLASIVSNSWGSTALDTFASSDLVDAATKQSMVVNLHQQLQAAGQGVGLYFASGDYGDESAILGQKAVDFPSSSPFVTAVGGTSSGVDKRGRVVFSAAWGEHVAILAGKGKKQHWSPKLPGDFAGGAGGGVSSLFKAPAYQAGVVPAALSHGMRTSADVAALAASTTGFAIGLRPLGTTRYVTGPVGGTSLATPIVAAQVALAQQASGRRLGFLSPALYTLAKRSPGAFRDVAPSTTRRFTALKAGKQQLLITVDRDSSLKARTGYDLSTGLGELTAKTLTALGRL